MTGAAIRLDRNWQSGARIGCDGSGGVSEPVARDEVAAVKVVPRAAGAAEGSPVVDLPSGVSVVPIIDGDGCHHPWVVVMPRARQSLREFIRSAQRPSPSAIAVEVLRDSARGLARSERVVVHQDRTSENVRRDGRSHP
jgi:hypothetical protein